MSATVPFAKTRPPVRPCELETGHERRERARSGLWTCTLTTVTPLCIQSYFKNLQDADPATVPGSSLRGMVRNAMEMLGAGCARFYQGAPCPEHLRACSADSACLVCRVFGFVDSDIGWAGKVRFGDTAATKVTWVRYTVPMTGRPAQEESHGPGWIVFPHVQPNLRPEARGPVRCIGERQALRFRVEYLNLDAEEFALFKFALTLAHPGLEGGPPIHLYHKLGFAKALGLGSCSITILNDRSPQIGREIEPYLRSEAFQVLATHRRAK